MSLLRSSFVFLRNLVTSFILKINNFVNIVFIKFLVNNTGISGFYFLMVEWSPPGGEWLTSSSTMKHSLTQSLLINVCLVVVHQQSTSASFMQFFEPFVFLQSSLLELYYLTLFSERCLIVSTIQFQQSTNHEWQYQLPWIYKLSNFYLHYEN